MKKILLFLIVITASLTLSGCTDVLDNEVPEDLTVDLGSEESLATLSYLSTGFLDFENTTMLASNVMFLSATEEDPETVIEGELDEINIYVDRLKALMDNGLESFGSVLEEVSDNELYDFKLTFTVNEETYIIYYNLDEVTQEMTGIIVIGEVEYEFEVMDNIKTYEFNEEQKHENEGTDQENENGNSKKDDELDEEEVDVEPEGDIENDNDIEEDDDEIKMVLIATNGDDTIKIIYKTELEDGEFETKFYVEQTIGGITKNIALKIEQEENETKVKITDGEDEYTFKREVEEEGVVYKLQYQVDGVTGMVKITEITAEDGTITYDYFIQEAGKEKHTEKQEPKSNFDEEEEESEEETDEV